MWSKQNELYLSKHVRKNLPKHLTLATLGQLFSSDACVAYCSPLFFTQQDTAQLGRIVSWRGKHIYRIKISVKLNENKILIPLLWIEMSSNWTNDLLRNSSHANHLYQGPRRFHVNPYHHFYISLHQHTYIYSYFNFIQL